jgi:hypothetical protein
MRLIVSGDNLINDLALLVRIMKKEIVTVKRVLLVLVAIILVTAVIWGGVLLFGNKGPKVKEPFTLDFKADEATAAALVKGDDMGMLLSCSPFYAGAPLPAGQQTYEFDEVKAQKVEQIIAASDDLAKNALTLKDDVGKLRDQLMSYMTVCYNNEPSAKTFALDVTRELLRIWTLETLTEVEYKNIKTDSENDFTRSFMQYAKTAKAMQLAALYLQDIDTIAMSAGMAVDQLSSSKNAKVVDATKKLDSDMAKLDSLKGRIKDVQAGMAKVDYGFKQLATADYYYAYAAVDFMRKSMPDLKQKLAEIKPNKYLDAKSLEFTKEYLEKFDKFSADFEAYLSSVPKDKLIEVTDLGRPGNCAYAAEPPNNYTNAYLAARAPLSTPASAKSEEGWLSKGWNGVKSSVHGVQSVLGAGLDVAGAAVKNISRVGTGIYYGNSCSEIWEDMKANSMQIVKNWEANKSGSKILRDAKDYFDYWDEGAEYVTSKGVEAVVGEGWTSWGVGKVAKAASGMFTGLGKGIALVSNRDASASDYVIGAIEIGSSALGGSKLIIKGTQLPAFTKGLAKGGWLSANRAWNFVSGLAANLEASETKAIIKSGLKQGLQMPMKKAHLASVEAMLAALNQSNKAIRAELVDLIKTGAAAGWANFKGTLRESLHDFAKKQFTNNLRGLAEALGASASDFVNNIMAQWGEDYIKGVVDDVMAEAPLPEEIGGKWTGTTVFSDVDVSQIKNPKAQGCDLGEIFAQLKGKTLLTTLNVQQSSTGVGNASLKISAGKDSESVPARYTYNNGQFTLKATSSEFGALTVDTRVVRRTQGYSMSGTVVFTAPGIRMAGPIKLSKSH